MSQIVELSDISVQAKVLALLQRCAGAELIEYMIVTLRQWLENNARTLQKISSNPCPDDLLFSVEENLSRMSICISQQLHAVRTWMYLPNREELSLRVVFALPNASRTGLVAKIWRSTSLDSSKEVFVFVFAFESGGLMDAR